MKGYRTDEGNGVPYWSQRVHQREQITQVSVANPDLVLVRFE